MAEFEWKQDDCYFEVKGPIARFTLNRPEKRNAYTRDIWEGLARATDDIKDDVSVRVLIVTGAGDKAFCAGPSFADDSARKEGPEKALGKEVTDYSTAGLAGREIRLQHMARWKVLMDLNIPVICRLNGLAVGAGMDLVLACDMIVAAEHAYLGQWYAKRGLPTDMGGAWYLPRLVGMNRAREIIYTARNITAQEAKEMGIVNRVVSYDKLDEAVDELCQEIIANAPLAIRVDKELLRKSWEMEFWDFMEYMAFPVVMIHQDEDFKKEGFQAFREKRAPRWKGR